MSELNKKETTINEALQSEIEMLRSMYNDEELTVHSKDNLMSIVYLTKINDNPIKLIFAFKMHDIASTIIITLKNTSSNINNLTDTTIDLIVSHLINKFKQEIANMPVYQTISYFNNELKQNETLFESAKDPKPKQKKKKKEKIKKKKKKTGDDEEKKIENNDKPKSYDKCPPIQMIIRDNKGWRLYKQDTKTGKLYIISDSKPCNDADIVFSKDGKVFAVLLEEGIEIYKSSKGRLITFLKHDRVRNVYFSPLNTFIVSYHHRRKEDKNGNCYVWKWIEKEYKLIYQFFLSEFDKKAVPISFSDDEYIAAEITNNTLLIHDTKRFNPKSEGIIGKMEVMKGVSVVIAPYGKKKKSYILAVFAKATTTKAATVTIYEYEYGKNVFSQISQRQFFVIDECKLLWDPAIEYHHNLLVIVSSDVDSSGKSYYGNQELFLMSSQNNTTMKIEVATKLQDVDWHPSGKEFVLIDDHPPKISIFDKNGKNIYNLGKYSRNMIRFSNCGNFLWLGGFGNLSGDMTFYDYRNIKNDTDGLKGYNKDSSCRYFEWSADASLFVAARIYPYMTVDNGFTIYKYNACKLYEEKCDRLYQVAYRPSLNNVYPEKMVSSNALAQSKPLPQPQAKKRYVPPHLRNKRNNDNKKKGTKRYFG